MKKTETKPRSISSAAILQGSLRALARKGVRRVSIDDICEEAQISKRTLYRYFAGRNEIIAAIADYIEEEFSKNLDKAIQQTPALDKRVGLVAEFLIKAAMSPGTARLSRAEGDFVLANMNKFHAKYQKLVLAAINPVFENRPDLAAAGLTAVDLAQMIFRLASEALLMPDHASLTVVKTIERYWQIAEASARLVGVVVPNEVSNRSGG